VRDVWAAFRVCAPVLGANVTAEQREAARERIDAFNAILREASAKAGFLFTNAVHDARLQDEDVGPVDGFHPSLAGQDAISNATWQATPWAR
jgi:lysophospholipase L1-like esterase